MKYLAAIDIGSNAIRLAIAKEMQGRLFESYRSRDAVRLGSSVFSDGYIDQSIYETLRETLLQFKNQLGNYNVSRYRAVATSAMREASNGQEVAQRLKIDTGLEIEIISGEEEARLVTEAIAQKVDLSSGNYLLIDIGGGSIELILMEQGRLLRKKSFKIGMVRLLELNKGNSEKLEKWLPDFVKEQIGDFLKIVPVALECIGTGGNMDRFGKMKGFVSSDDGDFLTLKEMKGLLDRLEGVPYKERIGKFGLKPDRADVIIPAAMTTVMIMETARSSRIHFPQVGLKDGILYELAVDEIKAP